MFEHVKKRLHPNVTRERRDPFADDERTADNLEVANSTEVHEKATKLPKKVDINDPTVADLVSKLQEIDIKPVRKPIPLDRISDSQKNVANNRRFLNKN